MTLLRRHAMRPKSQTVITIGAGISSIRQQGAGEPVGDLLAGRGERFVERDAQAVEHAVSNAFANFVGDRPLLALGPFGEADDDRALAAILAVMFGEMHEPSAVRR